MTPISIIITTENETFEWEVGGETVALSCNINPTVIVVNRVWDDGSSSEVVFNMANVVKVEVDSVPDDEPAPTFNPITDPLDVLNLDDFRFTDGDIGA